MATVPQTLIGRIEFFEQHLPVWGKTPEAIGLTSLELVDLANLTVEARAEYDAAQAARSAAKAATEAQNNAVSAMYEVGSGFIKTIRAFAEKTNDPSVYVAAEIPAPQPPTPAGPPETPTEFQVALMSGGGLRLSWKGTVAQSAYFSVYRKAEGEANFTLLDSTDAKFFEDTTIPAGTNSVFYFIQARRDEFRVNSVQYFVNFAGGNASVSTLSMAA